MTESNERVTSIIGSGKIGQCWAILFASGGFRVRLHDVSQERLDSAMKEIQSTFANLNKEGLLRGKLSIEEQLALISTHHDLSQCLKNSYYVQECVFEDLDLKKKVLSEIDELLDADTIVASSTSTIPPSKLTQHLTKKDQYLVAHPINPPIYCPLVELVPAPWTKKEAMDRAYSIMTLSGQSPVRLSEEVDGFVVNRLQYALLAECWNMVRSGLVSAEDIDKVVSEGLGMRWAFLGPIEVTHLNANGCADHNSQYGAGFKRVTSTFRPPPDLRDEDIQKVAREDVEKRSDLASRRAYRDKALMELVKLKKRLNDDGREVM